MNAMVVMAPSNANPPLLKVGEFAAAMRMSDETIRRRIADGTIRALKFGGLVRIPASELERVLGAGR